MGKEMENRVGEVRKLKKKDGHSGEKDQDYAGRGDLKKMEKMVNIVGNAYTIYSAGRQLRVR